MGGKAFSLLLPDAVFPRMPPSVYNSLKDRLLPRMSSFYSYVAVPYEAPEKKDHGDLDIVVTIPKDGETVPHEQIKEALGSTVSIPLEGYRTSHYAVPIPPECFKSMHIGESDAKEAYYQVDVHICEDKTDLDRYIYFHSYGDSGMLLGVIARSVGLGFSSHGLKLFRPEAPIPDPPHLQLTSSFPEIFNFFSLSEDAWSRGFNTQSQVFDWLMTCRFFDPSRTLATFGRKQKAKPDRTMFYEFPDYVRSIHGHPTTYRILDIVAIQQEALLHFGKQGEFDAIVHEKQVLRQVKELFNGNLVMEWTGLKYWRLIRRIMDQVRTRLGDNWKEIIVGMSVEQVRSLTMEVKECVLREEELEQSIAKLKVDLESDGPSS